MKGKIAILALAAIFSFGVASMSYAEAVKATDAPQVTKISCKKQATKMKFKNKKERSEFMTSCKKGPAKK